MVTRCGSCSRYFDSEAGEPATGASIWWRDHADHHMHVLLSPDGPFARSKDTCEPGAPLPYIAPPAGWFPDVRR
jgi:hypothetical protein